VCSKRKAAGDDEDAVEAGAACKHRRVGLLGGATGGGATAGGVGQFVTASCAQDKAGDVSDRSLDSLVAASDRFGCVRACVRACFFASLSRKVRACVLVCACVRVDSCAGGVGTASGNVAVNSR